MQTLPVVAINLPEVLIEANLMPDLAFPRLWGELTGQEYEDLYQLFQQEVLSLYQGTAKALGYNLLVAHEAAFDYRATRRVWRSVEDHDAALKKVCDAITERDVLVIFCQCVAECVRL